VPVELSAVRAQTQAGPLIGDLRDRRLRRSIPVECEPLASLWVVERYTERRGDVDQSIGVVLVERAQCRKYVRGRPLNFEH
jgi:hypothetical protein